MTPEDVKRLGEIIKQFSNEMTRGQINEFTWGRKIYELGIQEERSRLRSLVEDTKQEFINLSFPARYDDNPVKDEMLLLDFVVDRLNKIVSSLTPSEISTENSHEKESAHSGESLKANNATAEMRMSSSEADNRGSSRASGTVSPETEKGKSGREKSIELIGKAFEKEYQKEKGKSQEAETKWVGCYGTDRQPPRTLGCHHKEDSSCGCDCHKETSPKLIIEEATPMNISRLIRESEPKCECGPDKKILEDAYGGEFHEVDCPLSRKEDG